MRARFQAGRLIAAAWLSLGVPAVAGAQPPAAPPAATHVSMADAVRLALAHNHQLIAQRLNVDISKADEITAGLKPNPVFTSTNENFPVFSPSQLTGDTIANNANYIESLSYLFERGGKRKNRILVAQDTTDVTAKTTADAERQLRFQTEQAFINVLLAKSTLALAEDDLKNFGQVVEVNRERLKAGALAEADFYRIHLQQLQFEQDVSASQVALVQAKAALRQSLGIESVTESFDVDGDLAYRPSAVSVDDVRQAALESRPDLRAAQSNTKLAEDTRALAFSNRTRDVTGEVEYDRAGPLNALGFGLSIELPFHDRNQGNIAHSKVAIVQAQENEAAVRTTVLTDVESAFAGFQTNRKVVGLYQSGYLDEAKQSLDITTYVFQRGGATITDLLDAERTYRATQLAFRQALAAYMTSVAQLNFVVGRQVVQ